MTNFIFYNSYQSELTSLMSTSDIIASVASTGSLATPLATEVLRLTLVDPFDHTNFEIIQCTAVSELDLTITRGQEGTATKTWPVGTIVSMRATAEMLEEMASGFDNGGDTKGSGSVTLQPSRSSSSQVASGAGAIVVGRNTTASADDSIAIGDGASASGNDSIAIGEGSDASGVDAIAIGENVEAKSTKQISINHAKQDVGRTADDSCFINTAKYPAAKYQRHVGGYEYIAPHDWWYWGSASANATRQRVCQEMVIYSDPVNLGDSPSWLAATSYEHGVVIFPTTPNGKCYLCYMTDATYFASSTSGGSEPTWPTGAGDSVSDGDLEWICVDPADYQMLMPDYLRFTPTEFGFIADKVSDTTQPFISFGINGDLTKWLASTQATLLTGDYALQMFTPTNSEGAKQFGAGLVTAGAGDYTGRFYWKGLVTEILSP